MKKSLNNRFKGKRLVTGDENEITDHEILLKEENNKVVVKEKDTDGKIKQISGISENIIKYYIRASVMGDIVEEVEFEGSKPFTTLYDLLSCWESPSEAPTYIKEAIIIEYDKIVQIPVNKDIAISNIPEISSDNITISVPRGAKGVGILPSTDIHSIIECNICSVSIANPKKPYIVIPAFVQNPSTTQITANALYDVTNNILYYYEGKSSLYININNDLAESLRIMQCSEAKPQIYVNKEFWKGDHYSYKYDDEGFVIKPTN